MQTILSSAGLRKPLIKYRARELRRSGIYEELRSEENVTLSGWYNACEEGNQKLVILIHGWLGCHDSSYCLSLGSYLLAHGYSVYRLNLRDHGNSEALNAELFHSARMQEVLDALELVQRRHPHQYFFLAGFSLGGNFALRVGADMAARALRFEQIVSICPVADPANAMRCITEGLAVYEWYFVRKWHRSLLAKLRHYPELAYAEQLPQLKTLKSLNEFLIPSFTQYKQLKDYFAAYALTGNRLAPLTTAAHIIHAADDPVVPAADLKKISKNENLTIHISEFGGHCGFLQNWWLQSWVDCAAMKIFERAIEH